MTQNQIVGTWRLVSFESRDADGQISYPYGADAIGYLIYTSEGYMSASVMSANRPKFAAGDILGGTTEEQAMAARTYTNYCGKYDIEANKVIHHVETCLFPNYVGLNLERFFEFMGNNRLSLSTAPFLLDGKQQTCHVIWERVGTNKG